MSRKVAATRRSLLECCESLTLQSSGDADTCVARASSLVFHSCVTACVTRASLVRRVNRPSRVLEAGDRVDRGDEHVRTTERGARRHRCLARRRRGTTRTETNVTYTVCARRSSSGAMTRRVRRRPLSASLDGAARTGPGRRTSCCLYSRRSRRSTLVDTLAPILLLLTTLARDVSAGLPLKTNSNAEPWDIFVDGETTEARAITWKAMNDECAGRSGMRLCKRTDLCADKVPKVSVDAFTDAFTTYDNWVAVGDADNHGITSLGSLSMTS